MYIDTFMVITMKTRNGKTLYLKASDKDNTCEWCFDVNKAIWFDAEQDAKKFAKKYFKNFRNYNIMQHEAYI